MTLRLSFSKALTGNSYLCGKLLGHVVTKGQRLFNGLFPFYPEQWRRKLSSEIWTSIHKLTLKNKPTVRTIHRSESEAPLYLYTLWCTYIQALFLVTAARLSSTLVQSSRERQQGSWPLLFTAVSAPKLTSGGTLRSTDMETNKCFYLRAHITSGAPNSRTGWLWQSNGPASLFPHVPDGNFSTLTYKLHFPKSRFRLDPSADMRGRQKEIRARFESSANGFSFYDDSKWASLCCQKMVMWFIGLPWGTVMEQSNSDTDNRIC